jgi:uroporphyrinogen III methyltransferase/synthase
MVYLVGAGPGDPGLLTLRGQACLEKADLILYDYLVNPRLLSHASGQAELVCLGRHGQGRLLTQEEVHARLVTAAQSGQTVVRLKGGDTAIFGRVAEETVVLEAAGVPYEIVPGITTALATGSYAGIPLTHRDHASCVALVTGRQSKGPARDLLAGGPDDTHREEAIPAVDFGALANFPGTLVFYMGVTTAPVWVKALMDQGKPPETPVAVVRNCSLPQQEVFHTTLSNLPERLAKKNIRPPAIIVVGEVARPQVRFDWFTARGLSGRRVLVTRPVGQAASLVEQLDLLGAEVFSQPTIEILPPADWKAVDTTIGQIDQFDWLVFSSANGVRFFLDRLPHLGRDLRSLGGVRLATMGPATTHTLAQYHLHTDCQPTEYRAEALAELLAAEADNQRFLLLRANRGREVLAETLQDAGGRVEQVAVYQSQDVQQADPEITRALAAGQIDWVTVTSSAIARSLIGLFGEQLRQSKLAAISPLTADVLTTAGYPPHVVATEYTDEGLVEAIVKREGRGAGGE